VPELPAAVRQLAARVRNWGRWGPDDELGTLNLIDAAAVLRGAAEIRSGRRIPLGIPLDEQGPQTGVVPGRINPLRTMLAINHPYLKGDPRNFCNSDDSVTMGLQSGTHWDALAHVSYAGRIWNGYPADVVDHRGARRCGIEKVRTLVSRGVLLDVARVHGAERLPGGHAVTAEDLDAAAELGRVRIEPGDLVFVRTGHLQLWRAGDRAGYVAPAPGPSLRSVEWLRRHDVAAVATDSFTGEVFPPELPDTYLPVHLLHLVEMGLTQGQNFDLEALARDCAEDGRYAFFVDATPLPFTRAVGSPVNPVAIK
jgi:kynurenine formamidase